MTQPHAIPENSGTFIYRGCTAKSVVIGLLGAAVMAMGIPYGEMIIKGSKMGVWNTNPGSIFLIFVIVAIINVILGKIHRSLALDKSELAVVYIMLLIANTLPARGFSGYVLPTATGASYYANPENNWEEFVLPYLPQWATVQDENAIVRFYEGDPSNPSIPWDVWTIPLLFWLVFALALYTVMISIAVILRKQWVEHERLVYPMMQLPLHMIQDDEQRSVIKPFFKRATGSFQHGVTSKCDITLERLAANRFEVCGV